MSIATGKLIGWRGWFRPFARPGYGARGAVYLLLFTFSIWWSAKQSSGDSPGGGGSGDGLASIVAAFIGAGPVSLILGSVFVIVGVAHVWKALRCRYRDHLKASETTMKWIDIPAIGGLCARGLIFLIIAFLFLRHGLSGRQESASLTDALGLIAGLPLGSLLMGATGIGFLLFSLYSFAEAVWRRVNADIG